MKNKKALLTAVIVAAAITGAAAGRFGRGISERGYDVPCTATAIRLIELSAHLSAFTGITYWLFSGTAGLLSELRNSSLLDILRALPDIEIRKGPPERNMPGAYTL